MATATARPRSKAKPPTPSSSYVPGEIPILSAAVRHRLAIASLFRHPDNRVPCEAAIAAVAESLAVDGQIDPVIVRPLGSQYQIISGETRWLAAQRLGWTTLNCEIRPLSDAAALRTLAAANAARQDLDPISKARLIQRLCEDAAAGGGGLTREEAGRLFDLQSGGAASNLVRLLELPATWQQRVETGALPQSYARELLRLCVLGADSPAWADAEEEWPAGGPDDINRWSPFAARGSLAEFVDAALSEHTRPIDKGDAQSFYKQTKSYQDHPLRFKLTPSLEEELRIVTIELRGTQLRRATNCALYDSFQIPAIKAYEAKRTKRVGGDDESPAQASKKPLTTKEQVAEDKRKREEADEKLAKRIQRWRAAWLRELVAERITDEDHADLAIRICLWLQTRVEFVSYGDRENLSLSEGLAHIWGVLLIDPWRGVVKRTDSNGPDELVAHWLRAPARDGYEHPFPDANVEDLVALMEIDLADAWGVMQSTSKPPERFAEFFALHSRDQLVDLGRELGVVIPDTATKAAAVKILTGLDRVLKLPKCLAPKRGK